MTEAPLRALVVGGTGGIGRAIAARLVQDGARVVIAGRDPDRAQAAAAALGSAVLAVTAEAGDPAQCADMVAAAEAHLGGIDALFSCAGGNPMPRLLAQIPLEELMGTIGRSLAPTILPARAVLPGMTARGGGSILCVASDAGKLATPGEVAIGTAMAGIMMFCRAMAYEAKRQGIRVNCLTPSIVEGTALHDSVMADEFAGRLFGKAKTLAHLGVVQPQDLAEMAVFLASPRAARITGQCISITGGISAI
ncbi:SDR family NAD(P)-dependent oxidoreductase [Xinfangfangia pollutisoli]|uniref:SDR family NAD(P)-dependent oxidoreductase n=1 Tax=Xinfangfangia pollutisoli TaxID=2865960 RepID=UPI001CD4CD45|nr:SDR family oxidoreductase [Xinfangfangia pollutisoli]